MKKPVLISSLIHLVVFGGLAIAVISRPKPISYTESSNAISGVELNAAPSESDQNQTQEMSKKGEEVAKNAPSSGTMSQDSGGSERQNRYFFELQKKIQAEERYPKEAKKRGIEDTVTVQFTLGDQGQITQISLFSRPKSEILGEAALEAVKAASPFSAPPAGISREFRIPIEFKIK